MTKEALTVQYADRVGAEVALQSITIADGFTFPNDGHTLFYVENDAGAMTITFTIQKTLDGQSATRAVEVAASENWVIGPFPMELYNDANDLVNCVTDQDLATCVALLSY